MENLNLVYIDKDGNRIKWHKNNFNNHKKKHYEIQLKFFQDILVKIIKSPDKIYRVGENNYVLYGIEKGIGQFKNQNMKVCTKYSKIKRKRKIIKTGYIKSAYFVEPGEEEKYYDLIWPKRKKLKRGSGE
jgi:hypothetical protein